MNVPNEILEVHKRLKEAGYKAYLVGGCVRDRALGKVPKDWDIASAATPEQVMALFGGVIPTGIEHGTVTVVKGPFHIEVTTFRTEGDYKDGRRPEKVEFVKEIEADLSRRDFTINAMAWDPQTDETVDPFGGMQDLKNRIIRCVRDPVARFTEDGLRCLRAVRFATVLDFNIEAATMKAISGERLEVFKKVADERKTVEFVKIITSTHAQRGLLLLYATDLLTTWIPGLIRKDYSWFSRDPKHRMMAPEPNIAMVLRDNTKEVVELALQRIKLSRLQLDHIRVLVNTRAPEFKDPPTAHVEARRLLAKVDVPAALQLVMMDQPAFFDGMLTMVLSKPAVRAKDLAINGNDVKKIFDETGFKYTGKDIGVVIQRLVEKVVDDQSLNTKNILTVMVTFECVRIATDRAKELLDKPVPIK